MKPPFSSLLLIVFFLISLGLKCKQEDKSSPEPSYPSFFVETSPMVEAANKSIPSSGGELRIEEAGHPLNGFLLTVPDGGYPSDLSFSISYADALTKDFGNQMKIVSPIIEIDNGGEYAKNPMTVTIPLSGHNARDAMGFIYDAESGRVEALPTIANGDSSITVLTHHFTGLFAGANTGDEESYFKEFNSGFKPGTDDWQMGNARTSCTPTGQCSGQSMGMLWYYREKRMKGNAPQLNGLFESDGINLTAGFGKDDANALKFCGVVQCLDENLRAWGELSEVEKVTIETERLFRLPHEETMKLFAKAFMATAKPAPQFILVKSATGRHAMVVYGMLEGALFIADPNFPGNQIDENFQPAGLNRRIVYDKVSKKYKPYTSGDHVYTDFAFMGETTMVPWKEIEKLWPTLKTGEFEEKYFPKYQLMTSDENDNPVLFKNGFTLKPDGLLAPVFPIRLSDKKILRSVAYDEYMRPIKYSQPLSPGIHKIGIESLLEKLWIGFDWIEVLVPERRIKEDQPHIYHGHDFNVTVTLDGKRISIDSIDFKISDSEKQMIFSAYDKTGPRDEHLFSFFMDNWRGVGNYTDALGQYVVGENTAETYYEGKANVQITQWSGGVFSGNFSFEADNIDNKRVSITCSFRYPR